MKRLLWLLLIGACAAQMTPNIGLNVPTPGTQGNNWGGRMNNNFSAIDSYLGGTSAVPHGLSVTGLLCTAQLGNPTGNIQVVGCGANATIQAAINAVPVTGGNVLIPPGTYAASDVTLKQNNITLQGSGVSTVITPSGGAGHWGIIMGTPDPSSVNKLTVRDLAIQCPGSGDLTGGILIRKAVAVQNLVDSVRLRGCATGINVGESGLTLGASTFGNTLNNIDIEVTGSQVGVLVGQADGTNIINSSIRDNTDILAGSGTSNTCIGIHIIGPATRTEISNDYIEFIPGGNIVLDTSSGIVQSTMIHDNYMETYGPNGYLLNVGSGVFDTFFHHNYSNSNAVPSANYEIQIANGALNVNISDSRLQNRKAANIHNLNVSAKANILISNIDIASSTSPLIDSLTGVEVKSYTTSGPAIETMLAKNPVLGLQAVNAGGFKQLLLMEPSTGAMQHNWCVGVSCDHATNLFEIGPSTTNGGTTFPTPLFSCTGTQCSVNGNLAVSTLNAGTGTISSKAAVAGCVTGSSAGAVCTTSVNWPSPMPDATYTAICQGDLVTSGVPIIGAFTNKVGAGVIVQTIAVTAAAAQFTSIECIAMDN